MSAHGFRTKGREGRNDGLALGFLGELLFRWFAAR